MEEIMNFEKGSISRYFSSPLSDVLSQIEEVTPPRILHPSPSVFDKLVFCRGVLGSSDGWHPSLKTLLSGNVGKISDDMKRFQYFSSFPCIEHWTGEQSCVWQCTKDSLDPPLTVK